METGRVALIGAVHESLDALRAIAAHPEAKLVCVVTLSEQAAFGVSGTVDLSTEAARLGVDVLRVDNVNSPESVERIRQYAPDLIAVVGWTRLIRDELLTVPRRGCVGFHASLLPRHRGRAPVNWSIIKGESETGNTLMLLNAGVDTGGIIDQRATPISPEDTCATVYERVAQLGADMLRDNLGPLLAGGATPRTQDDSISDLLPKRTPDMGVTDWRRSASEIHDWIRAQTLPYPGAYTGLGDQRVMLWSSEPPELQESLTTAGAPGEIVDLADGGVRIATGCGTLLVTKMGPSGETPMNALDWAAWAGAAAGTHFSVPSPSLAAWALGEGPPPSVSDNESS